MCIYLLLPISDRDQGTLHSEDSTGIKNRQKSYPEQVCNSSFGSTWGSGALDHVCLSVSHMLSCKWEAVAEQKV